MSPAYERIPKLIDFLFAGGGHPSSWRQEPYKSDFFKVFIQNPDLHGDQIRQHMRETWLRTTARSDEKYEVLGKICDAWDEWKYALEKTSSERA